MVHLCYESLFKLGRKDIGKPEQNDYRMISLVLSSRYKTSLRLLSLRLLCLGNDNKFRDKLTSW